MNYPYSSFEDDGQYQTDLSEVASRNADEEAAGINNNNYNIIVEYK